MVRKHRAQVPRPFWFAVTELSFTQEFFENVSGRFQEAYLVLSGSREPAGAALQSVSAARVRGLLVLQ
jgi:hypothetical protein